MPNFDSYPAGTPCWIDLMSPDAEASAAFYESVFGWKAEPEHDDDGNRIYTQFWKDDRIVAGLGGQPPGAEGMPAIWNTYICVDDAEAAVASAQEAGGSVMMPAMQVMDAGHMAILSDPTGAAISVWQPNEHVGAGVANEPGTWSWNELLTRDVDTARDFYSKVFGWEYDSQEMPTGTYHVIKGGDYGGLGGLMAMPPGTPEQVPNHWAVYFNVSDIAATIDNVQAAGGQVVQGPMEVPEVGHIATVHDPNGGSLCLMQPASN